MLPGHGWARSGTRGVHTLTQKAHSHKSGQLAADEPACTYAADIWEIYQPDLTAAMVMANTPSESQLAATLARLK